MTAPTAGHGATGRWAAAALDPPRTFRVRLPDDAYDPIAEELAAGTWSPPSSQRLTLAALAPGRVLLDVGAHLGTVALPAAGRGARVVAVEASPRNAACLAESAAADHLDVTVLHAAAADRHQVLHFHEDGPYGQVVEHGGVTVDADTLPALLGRAGLDRADVVKIDVEGHEPAVLAGARAMLRGSDAPAVVCEGNGFVLAQSGHTTGALAATLEDLGFRVFLVGEGELVPFAGGELAPANVVDLFATKAATAPWPVRRPFTDAERAALLASELTHAVPTHRRWAAQALRDAPPALLVRREVTEGLEACAWFDADPDVRYAASWWRARRVELAAAHRDGAARTLATVGAHWSAVADDAVVLARHARHTRQRLAARPGA